MSVPIRPTPKMRRPSADVRAQKADLDQLDRFRKSAENWRNGLTGLTALLGVATAIRGPELAAELSTDTRKWVVLIQLAGLFFLLLGALFAMNAAYGMPAPLSDHSIRLLNVTNGKAPKDWALSPRCSSIDAAMRGTGSLRPWRV
jgi:hypothetical protein